MNYIDLLNDFEEITEIYNEIGFLRIVLLKKYNYPEEIKNLIVEDHKTFEKIIKFYYEDINIKINNGKTYEQILTNFEFIENITSIKKEKYIKFNTIIKPWLTTINFIIDIVENTDVNLVTNDEIIEYQQLHNNEIIINGFKFRINQIDAFTRLERNGLEIGVHCQATGCGKTLIIIRYIDYMIRNFENPKIILFTERVNILADLFDFDNNNCIPRQQKILEWLNIGVGDLRNLDIINRVTNKTKDWNTLLANATKPTLLVINRAFLTKDCLYKSFEKNDINLILHDECHNTSSIQCNTFLKFAKSRDIPIVGFSATPLRTGKNDLERLLAIYAEPKNEKNLNLLTDYNMIYAIANNLIVPPEFFWYQIESYNKRDNKELVTQEELGSVLEILNLVVPSMPNKKIVAWCGTVALAKEWKRLFEVNYKQRVNLKKFEFGIDTSMTDTNDYDKFKEIDGNMILFCAQKHREGSDIKRLDACIFLDKVCNRGSIPFIQSIGRVLRISIGKLVGTVIDGYVKENNNYEKTFVDKILGYYFALQNITSDFDSQDKYESYTRLMDIIKFDTEQQLITLNINSVVLKINCQKLEWKNIVSKFASIIQQKVKLTDDELFTKIINKLKEMEQFQNCENDFCYEYSKLDHEKLHFPFNILERFSKYFDTNTWYNLLGFKTFLNLDELRKEIGKRYTNIKELNEINYNKLLNKINVPKYPLEYYRLDNITCYQDLLCKNNK
jgi:superfamily II DNA or RNA helicase